MAGQSPPMSTTSTNVASPSSTTLASLPPHPTAVTTTSTETASASGQSTTTKSSVPTYYLPSQAVSASANNAINTAGEAQSTPTPGSSTSTAGQPFFDPTTAPGVWKNAWTMAYPYTSQTANSTGQNPYAHAQQYAFTQFQPSTYSSHYKIPAPTTQQSTSQSKPTTKSKAASPSPPPPDPCKDWDVLLRTFMSRLGLSQSLRGFELDMLVMNPSWEEDNVFAALGDLVKGIEDLRNKSSKEDKIDPIKTLDERKLEYVHAKNGVELSAPTSINKSISQFLSRKRLHNETSNRNEFLLSIAEKRARFSEDSSMNTNEDVPSCARSDAKPVDRESQMKYDIAKNEDGPLKRTMKRQTPAVEEQPQASTSSIAKGKGKAQTRKASLSAVPERPPPSDPLSADRHPGLDERLTNMETHLSVRYVPSPPLSLLDRLKFLEDHIIQLEKDYPPWAALHFNQPNRAWPPPPPVIPIIVPPHLTRDTTKKPANEKAAASPASGSGTQPKGKKDSSLHRAVLERLEVKNAKNILANRGT